MIEMFGLKDDFGGLKYLVVDSYIGIFLVYCGWIYYMKFLCNGLELMVSLLRERVVILFYCVYVNIIECIYGVGIVW